MLFNHRNNLFQLNDDIAQSKNQAEIIKNELKKYFTTIENLEKDYINEAKIFKKVKFIYLI